MIFDATFWVAISFFIFLGLLIYFKIPKRIQNILDESIKNIKNQIENAEQLKDEAKNLLNIQEKKLSKSKKEISKMVEDANLSIEKNILKTNAEFHSLMENKKKEADQRIVQMKNQALKDIKNVSITIALQSIEKLLKKSVDKSKLDKIFKASIEETKLALKKKSS